jgi:two-component system, chemotaxis family, chemotaxis protein CheY
MLPKIRLCGRPSRPYNGIGGQEPEVGPVRHSKGKVMHILLVDDSSTMRRIQRNTLERMGHGDVVEVEDGVAAMERLAAEKFDLVLLDWNMPNLNGMEVLKKIRGEPALKALPVIMVTSESEKNRIIEAVRAGASNYVVKPFTAEVLREKIAAVTR